LAFSLFYPDFLSPEFFCGRKAKRGISKTSTRAGSYNGSPFVKAALYLAAFRQFRDVLLPGYLPPSNYRVPHFWSLAVEEHFYLVWPFLVYLFSLKSLWKVCLLIIGLAFLARCVGVYLGLHPFYFTLTFCRFDALATKALLATFAHENTLVKLLPYAK